MRDAASASQSLEQLHFYRLLVAIDGSAHSEFVLAAAATAAHHDNSRLTLISVASKVPSGAAWGASASGTNLEQLQEDADAATAKLLRESAQRLPADVPVTTLFRRGRAAHEILAEIQGGDYDAVLMGARGFGRIRALVGSVSQSVLRDADIAVIIVHAPVSAPGSDT